jgi:hypothetical protein
LNFHNKLVLGYRTLNEYETSLLNQRQISAIIFLGYIGIRRLNNICHLAALLVIGASYFTVAIDIDPQTWTYGHFVK